MARELEVSTKTIHRDLEFMRDRLNLPLEYDGSRNGYFYHGEVSSFPTLQITEGEIFALVVAEKALQQYRGTSFEKPLLSAPSEKWSSPCPTPFRSTSPTWSRPSPFARGPSRF